MADPKMKSGTFTVRNPALGPRGFYDVASGFVSLDPGKSASDVRFTEPEYESALRAGLEISAGEAAADDEADTSDADGLPETKAALEKLAADEGVDVAAIQGTGANGNVVKADIVAAIMAHRAASAAGGTGGIPPVTPAPNDTLDKMSDADLRDTAVALVGADKVPAEADRETLLKLARGEA